MFLRIAMVLLAVTAGQAFCQTMVDLKTQSKSVDFSNLPSTKPATVGTAVPPNCQTGQLFFNSAAAAGSNLMGCTSTNTWTALAANTGGGGGGTTVVSGAAMSSQLGDFATTVSTGTNTTLSVGAGCSSTTPCNVRIGNTVRSIKFPGSVTTSGSGSGMVFLYIDNTGTLTAGSTANLSCSSCTYAPGVTSFPSDSIPLYTWTFTNGNFDPTTGVDLRSLLSTKNLVGGTGLLVAESGGTSTVSVDPALISLHVLSPPASSSAACSSGQFSYDTSFYYVCVATNTWMRAPLSTF